METTSRLRGDLKYYVVSQTQFASAVGLSAMRINQLIDEGIVIRDPLSRTGEVMLLESLQNFYQSRKTTGDGVNFWAEKALHEKAKRELSELKLEQERGEVYKASEVEAVLTEMLIDFRNKLSGLGHKLAAQLEGKSATGICAAIDAEIEQALEEVSDEIGKGITESPELGNRAG